MRSFIFTSLFFLLITACDPAKINPGSSIAEREPTTSEWTIFIYGHADHNLSPAMIIDYQEMIAANLNSRVKVILAVDLDDSSYGSTMGTKVYEILGGGKSRLIGSYSEQNFDDPTVLESHMLSAFSNYPSNKRGIILWDHGGSWDGGFGGDSQNDTDSAPTPLTIYQIKTVLQSVASQLNLGSSPFDFLSFDTCLMGNVESTSEYKDLAKYYFASAELDFGDGWDYAGALSLFGSSPNSSIVQLAPLIVDSWNSHHMNATPEDEKIRTQIAVDLSKLDSFMLQMNSLLSNYQITSLPEMGKALKRSGPGYGIVSETQALMKPQSYRDVGQFLSLLANSSNTSLSEDSTALLNYAQEQLVKAQSLGDIRIGSQLGFSIESRILSDWVGVRSEYLSLHWNDQTNWSALLDDMTSASVYDGVAPALSTTASNNTNPTSINKPRVSFSTNDSDVDKVELILKLTNSGVDYSLGLIGFAFVDDQSSYYFDWDGKFLSLSNGSTSSLVTLALQGAPGLNSDGDVLAVGYKIPGVLTDGTDSLTAYLIGYESPITTIALEVNGQIGSFEISQLAGSGLSFIPAVYKNQFPYFELMTEMPLSAGLLGMELVEESAPAGTYKIETRLSDVWMNTAVESDNVNVVTPF
jgi:hypothetical protein